MKALASGRVEEHLVLDELEELKRQRTTLEERRRALQPRATLPSVSHDADLFVRACRPVSEFLDKAGPEDRALALDALQIAIQATPQEATVHGVVPVGPPVYGLANNHADARFQVNNRPTVSVPFRVRIALC